jgi:hypothetical protein
LFALLESSLEPVLESEIGENRLIAFGIVYRLYYPSVSKKEKTKKEKLPEESFHPHH